MWAASGQGKSVSPEDYTTLGGWMTFFWIYPLIQRVCLSFLPPFIPSFSSSPDTRVMRRMVGCVGNEYYVERERRVEFEPDDAVPTGVYAV